MRPASMLPRVRPPAVYGIAALLVLLLAWMAFAPHLTPAAGPAATRFDSARALRHVSVLAQAPRPTGSAANARARDYLMAQIRALGLTPQVQVETVHAVNMDWMAHAQIELATVHNVIVRKPAAVAGGAAVLISAHYDTGASTLGAADGGASATAMLETLRVLQAGPLLANDLLFVFTDADAGQPLGLRAFLESHPLAERVGIALRFDNAGNRGPLELIDAAHADGALVGTWAHDAPAPHGSSFTAALYAGLPQHAAAAPLGGLGVPALQFATTAGTLGDDGMHDAPQRLSTASVRQEGETMLVLLRRFGNAALPPLDAVDTNPRGQVFFALPLVGMVYYSAWLVWPLAAAACALTAYACALARRRGASGVDIIHCAFGFLFMGMLAIFLTFVAREALVGLASRYTLGVLVDDDGVAWQLAGFLLLPAAILIALQRRLQQRFGASTVTLGVCGAGCAALPALCFLAPDASYVLAWPLLATAATWLALAHPRTQTWTKAARAALALAGALPALLLIVPAAYASLAFFTPSWLVPAAALACIAVGLCGAAQDLLTPRFIVRPLLLAGGACLGVAYAATPQSPTLAAPNTLLYYKDAPSWQAFWMAPPAPLDVWTKQIFPHTMHPYQLPYLFGNGSPPVWYAGAARDDSIAWPELLVEKDERGEQRRHVEFVLRSKNRAPTIVVRLVDAMPVRASVNGRLLTDRATFSWKLTLHGVEDRPQHFAFDFDGDPAFMVYIQERIPGLPPRDLPPRPVDLPPLLPQTGTTVAADVLRFQ